MRRGNAIADRPPGTEDPPSDDRPTLQAVGTFDVCSIAAVNSDLSCFLYGGRLKRPYLHYRADTVISYGYQLTAAETFFPSAPYRLDTPLSFRFAASGMRATAAMKQQTID